MGLFKTIAVVILSISSFVFIALFGRLPAFRKTPVGFLHRVIMKHIPAAFVRLDTSITGGRVARSLQRTIHYFMYEKHPTVLIFFLLLQLISEILIVPILLPTLHPLHYIIMPLLISLPYLFLYLCATTSSIIPVPPTILNQRHDPNQPPASLDFGSAHQQALRRYPYDYCIFHPGFFCPTCHMPKPARSKHCSLCRGCVQKMDHHCIWINNCVGRNNHLSFLLLVFSTMALLIYGASLGYVYLWDMIQAKAVPRELVRGSTSAKRWSTGLSWWRWADALLWACSMQPAVGGVTLLSLLCVPLAGGFGVYHGYLVWAGSTTNEQGKWADWREDVLDGLVWRARVGEVRGGGLPREVVPPDHEVPDWRGGLWRAEWWYIRTEGGEQPMRREGGVDERWEKVADWKVVENLYDQGWWNNLMEVFWDTY